MTELVRVTRGVWRPAAQLDDLRGRVLAILSICPAGSVVCGWTAAVLHGHWLPATEDLRIEVIVHSDEPRLVRRPGSRRSEIRARRQALRPDEVVVVDGIPLTTEARTWLDLADRLSLPDLVAAGDSALRGAATTEAMTALIGRAVHRRGVRNARAALPLLDARSRSHPESHLRYALVAAGLPAPQVNVPIFSKTGEWLAEPDLSYDDVRLAIEYNGAGHADVPRLRRDITRENDVENRGGWRMLTFGPVEVYRRPDEAARRVLSVRDERRRLLRATSDPWRR